MDYKHVSDTWERGSPYEQYVGRWSLEVAPGFLSWLNIPRGAEEMLQWAARQGISCASARCYASEGELAYAPVTTWMRALPSTPVEDVWLVEERLLPEVFAQRPDLPRPVPLTESWQRQRLFEAISRGIFRRTQPILLIIDDLQWCDRDTLETLHFLLRFDRKARLLVVGTYRPEEVVVSHPLVSWLQTMRLEGQVTELDLGPLDEAATHTLATRIAGVEIGEATAQLLHRETEGNPLFIVETVRVGLPIHDQILEVSTLKKLPGMSTVGIVTTPTL